MPYLNWNRRDEIPKEFKGKTCWSLKYWQCRAEEILTKIKLPERELKEMQSFSAMMLGLPCAIPELKSERWNSHWIQRETLSNPQILAVQSRRNFHKNPTSRKRTEGDAKFLCRDARPALCHTWTEIGEMKFPLNSKENPVEASNTGSAEQNKFSQKSNFQKENWRRCKVSLP